MATAVPCFHVTAFSDSPFKGNPAAVVCLPAGIMPPDAELLRIAAEFNLSETAFVETPAAGTEGPADPVRLRWFTPTVEVDLCGHATLATAHVLFTTRYPEAKTLRFSTRSGILTVERTAAGGYSMRFPYNPPRLLATAVGDLPAPLQCIVTLVLSGAPAESVKAVLHSSRTKKLLIELLPACSAVLAAAAPDFDALLAVDQSSLAADGCVTGVSLCIAADLSSSASGTSSSGGGGAAAASAVAGSAVPRIDFSSRYFAPWNGIPEDPVNGSSHTVLGPHFAAAAALASTTAGAPAADGQPARVTSLTAYQASKRTGVLQLEVHEVGDTASASASAGASCVCIGGHACTVLEGTIAI